MSDLIDRYLAAVAALLPKASRQDIVAELRDLIMNRLEEREAALGRALDKRETEALLREIGHPIAVAGRYGPRQALIGPEIYPFWAFGVKVALAIAAVVTLVPAVVVLIVGQADNHRFAGIFSDFIPTALSLVGCATLIGAAVERGWIQVGDLGQWKASDLPPIPRGWNGPRRKPWYSKSRFDGLFELVAILLFIAWWTGLMPFPVGSFERDGQPIGLVLSPVLKSLHWPILGLAVVQGISALLLVVKPGWVRPRAFAEIVCALAGLALVAVLWPAQPLVTLVMPGSPTEDLDALQRTIDLTFPVIMVVAAAINASKLAIDGWRLVKGR